MIFLWSANTNEAGPFIRPFVPFACRMWSERGIVTTTACFLVLGSNLAPAETGTAATQALATTPPDDGRPRCTADLTSLPYT